MTEIAILPKVEFLFTPVVNYAIQQNRIPLVRKFSIENRSEIQGKVCEIKKQEPILTLPLPNEPILLSQAQHPVLLK